jgi:hypothetical protein
MIPFARQRKIDKGQVGWLSHRYAGTTQPEVILTPPPVCAARQLLKEDSHGR